MVVEIGKPGVGNRFMRPGCEEAPASANKPRRNRMGRPPRNVEYDHPAQTSSIASAINRHPPAHGLLRRSPRGPLSMARRAVLWPLVDIPGFPTLWSGNQGHDWPRGLAWQGNSSAIGVSAADGANCWLSSVETRGFPFTMAHPSSCRRRRFGSQASSCRRGRCESGIPPVCALVFASSGAISEGAGR